MAHPAIDDDVFVRVYMEAHRNGLTLADVALRLGTTRQAVSSRSIRMRQVGVDLPPFPPGRPKRRPDYIERLNDLARIELMKEQDD